MAREKTVYDERDRTNEVATFVTYLNVERFLEHQVAALDSQIEFLSTAEKRLKGAIARKEACRAALDGARVRREQAERDVPSDILRLLTRGQDELGADAISGADLVGDAPKIQEAP